MSDISNIDIVSEAPDFSMFGLFMQADIVVKSVIIVLILASLYSWNVIVSKILRMRQLKKLEREFEDIFWSGNSFEDLYETLNFNKSDPKSKIFCAAILEWKKSKSQFDQSSNLNLLKEKYPKIIKEIRGRGLLIGIQLYRDQSKFIKKLLDNKLLTIRAAENVVRILPPLNVKKSELDQALKIIDKVCIKLK